MASSGCASLFWLPLSARNSLWHNLIPAPQPLRECAGEQQGMTD
jgi:hypothetical protein